MNPLALDTDGGYTGPPAAPKVAMLSLGNLTPAAATPTSAAPAPPPPAPAAAPAAVSNDPPANFTYHFNEATASTGLGTAAHFAMATVTSIADTLAYLVPSTKKKARGATSGDQATAVALASGDSSRAADASLPSRILASNQLAAHPRTAHRGPAGLLSDNVYLIFNVNTSLVVADYHGAHRVRPACGWRGMADAGRWLLLTCRHDCACKRGGSVRTLLHQGPLEKLTFLRVRPLVLDVNAMTRSPERLDVLVGLSNGEIILHNPFGGEITRFNKGVGCP